MVVECHPCMQVLNDILEFMGHGDGEKFTPSHVSDVKGFYTPYADDYSDEKKQAIRELTAFFEQPNKDLQLLMDTYFPDHHWQGLRCGTSYVWYFQQGALKMMSQTELIRLYAVHCGSSVQEQNGLLSTVPPQTCQRELIFHIFQLCTLQGSLYFH